MVHSAEHLLPTPSMKMAELIAVSPSLPGVLTRMGILCEAQESGDKAAENQQFLHFSIV